MPVAQSAGILTIALACCRGFRQNAANCISGIAVALSINLRHVRMSIVCAVREEPEDETLGMGRRGLLSCPVCRRGLAPRQRPGNAGRPNHGQAGRATLLRVPASPLALFDVRALT